MQLQQALGHRVLYWCFHRGATSSNVLLSSFLSRTDTDVAQQSEFPTWYTDIRMQQLERWLDGAQKSRNGSGPGVQRCLSRSAYRLCHGRPFKSLGTGSEKGYSCFKWTGRCRSEASWRAASGIAGVGHGYRCRGVCSFQATWLTFVKSEN